MANSNEISEVSERKIFDGYSDGTFYSLGTFLGFMEKLGARKIIHLFPKSYGGIEGGDEVWVTPEGIGVRYTYERGPEKITLPDPHAERTRWPGKAKVLAFGLEAKIDSFEAQVKQEAERFQPRNIVTTVIKPYGEPISFLSETTQGIEPEFPRSRRGKAE